MRFDEIKKGEKDANGYTRCWPGKHAEGTKKGKNGGQVRNCQPNESVNEMDKSQTPPGRDGGDPDAGKKQYTANATTPKKTANDAEKILNKEWTKSLSKDKLDALAGPRYKKKGVAEGSDERKQNALWAQITKHEQAAKKSKDLKRQHHLKMADQLRSQLKTSDNVDEGEVVQFPKKHRGDISDMHNCPKCGGDLQGGKYQGHQVQVCMPCKQVYLPPNSGIDQQGNKIKEGVAEAAKGILHRVRYQYDDPSGAGIASGHITLHAPDKAAAARYAAGDLSKKGKKNVKVLAVTPQKQSVAEGQQVDVSKVVGKLYDIIDNQDAVIKNADYDQQVQQATIVKDRAVKALNMIKTNPLDVNAAWNYLQNGEQGVTESEQSDLRKLQQQWWVALPAIMKQAGIDYHPVTELSRDYYPTLGWINIPGESSSTFHVSANPKGDSAKLNISVDVDTSNSLYRNAQPERAAKLSAYAQKIAQALGGTAAEHMTGQRRNHPGVSHITATMQLPKEPAGWQNPSRGYDPKTRFLNTPGERARQSRAARSGFPDSYGGDASNYRLEGIAEEYNAEYDDEAGMAHGSLHTLKNAVEGLQQVIDSGDNLPEWCQEKISLAEDYLVTVWDYLQSEKAQGIDPELNEEFDLIESSINQIADHNGVDAEMVWEDLESLSHDELYVFAVTSQLNEDWQKANKSDRTDGMSRKAVKAYRRANPGSKLQTAVTTKPSKLKKGSKASKRRKSYCSRSKGQMNMHNISCAKTPDKAICKARRRWNC